MASVQDILREIDALDDEQRRMLDRQLAERAQAEWDEVTKEARRIARERGIDQVAIDRAVERRRYGR